MKWLHGWLAKQPLSAKLKMANLVTSGTVIVLSSIFLLFLQAWLSIHALLDRTRTDAMMTSENLAVAMVFQDRKSAQDILSFLHASRAIQSAWVYDKHGKLFADYHRSGVPASPDPAPEALPAGRAGERISWKQVGWHQAFNYQGEPLGTILVLADVNILYTQLLSYIGMLVLLLAASLTLANLALTRIQALITQPLQSLSHTAGEISERGDFSIRAKVHPGGDIGRMAQTFNTMLDRIQRREVELTEEISQRERVQKQLDYLAHFDNVTGLHNRHYFNEQLELTVGRACRLQQCAALIFIDLDNFKTFNDTLGHATGDEVLRIVAQRVSHTVRADDVLSRVGGDEFAIIVRDIPDVQLAERVAQKFLEALAAPVFIGGTEIFISASIGISVCPDDATDMQDLLKYADSAMYHAKNSGKNGYCIFAPSMRGAAERRFAIEGSMRRALERNELQLLYQPKVDMLSGRIIGAEALVRWHSPELGLLGPHEFIPLAEETGMIIQIGEWVLRTACEQLKCWHDDGHRHLEMAVNLSGRQLREPNFVRQVEDVVARTGIDPRALELELTESMLMDAGNPTIEKLHALRSIGIGLAIDDFGTGYSSMSYLKMFPINTLKIDQSFVRDLPGDSGDCAIVQTILALAHNLQLQVVAEGIEKRGQADFLRTHGCGKAQGMLYGAPMTHEELARMLAAEALAGSGQGAQAT
ncbi:putative bifunctional diguanylate cyclase/phosphodiesterase [Lacisediminimonas profundi]|uniref:putative bifunctional diguanylate cyclase/phosphodiesterase n=1 Tax=Lacisediminimonas profundi TaxID=2603856 RepID=UPI00124BA025|nr:EAL domain-containing protein [Lacisediminimonas profundi]